MAALLTRQCGCTLAAAPMSCYKYIFLARVTHNKNFLNATVKLGHRLYVKLYLRCSFTSWTLCLEVWLNRSTHWRCCEGILSELVTCASSVRLRHLMQHCMQVHHSDELLLIWTNFRASSSLNYRGLTVLMPNEAGVCLGIFFCLFNLAIIINSASLVTTEVDYILFKLFFVDLLQLASFLAGGFISRPACHGKRVGIPCY